MQAQFNYSACLIFLVFCILQRSDCTKTEVFSATFTHICHLKSCSVLFNILDYPLEFLTNVLDFREMPCFILK